MSTTQDGSLTILSPTGWTPSLGVPVWVTLPLLLPAAFARGMALQVLLFGRALRHGVLAPVLVTFGLSVMIENLLQVAATSTRAG